jgi:hypothetical protein
MLDTDKYNLEGQQILQTILATISTSLWEAEVSTAAVLRIQVFWDVTTCRWVRLGYVPGVLKEQTAFISYSWWVQEELSSRTRTLGNERTTVFWLVRKH